MSSSISVVIATYNGAAFLGGALASVFAQTLAPCEIVVVDDASTDGTAALVEEMARTAPMPIRLIRLERNSGGPARPLNVGVTAAQGELIAVLDQDDVFVPEKLQAQADVLAHDPTLVFVFSFCAGFESREQWIQNPEMVQKLHEAGEAKREYVNFGSRTMLRLLVRHGNFTMGYPGFLFRRADWCRKGGADESLRISSDYDLLCWLAGQGPSALVPRVLYYRRDHEANLCRREREVYIETMRVKARYLNQERWLLDDPELSRELRQDLFGLAYWVRKAGRPRESLHYYLQAARLWGWDGRTLWALAKLLPYGVLRLFRRETARPTG